MDDMAVFVKKLLLVGALVLIILGLFAWFNSPLLMTVVGTGEVSVKASKASISLSVSDYNASPVIASQNVAEKASKLKEYLNTKGIESKDVMQTQVQVTPAGALVQGLSGYQASLSMGATLTDMAQLDNLVPTLYEKGASIVSQPVLQVADETTYEEQALQLAIKDANSKAFKLGLKNFKLLKKIASITISTNEPTSTVSNSEDTKNSILPADNTFKVAKAVSIVYRMW